MVAHPGRSMQRRLLGQRRRVPVIATGQFSSHGRILRSVGASHIGESRRGDSNSWPAHYERHRAYMSEHARTRKRTSTMVREQGEQLRIGTIFDGARHRRAMERDHHALANGSRLTRIVPRTNDATAPASRSSASASRFARSNAACSSGGHLLDVAEKHERRLRAIESSEHRREVGIGRDDDVVVFECVFNDALAGRLQQAHVVNADRLMSSLSQSSRDDRGEVGVDQQPHAGFVSGSSRSLTAAAPYSSAAKMSSRSRYG